LGEQGENIAGGYLKETGYDHWESPNQGATNTTVFTGLGAGGRFLFVYFSDLKYVGYFWASDLFSESEAFSIILSNWIDDLELQSQYLFIGHSLRFIADSGTPTQAIGNDGKIYPCVTIGNQTWTAANSNETKYRNGDWITGYDGGVYTPISNSAWAALTTGAMCYYDDLESNGYSIISISKTLCEELTDIKNDQIISLDVSGTTTKTVTLTQLGGGTLSDTFITSANEVIHTPYGTNTNTNVQSVLNSIDDNKVPYEGANRNVDLDTMALRTGYVDLVQQQKPLHGAYRLFADTTAHTLAFYNDEADITMQVGQEMWSRVYNDAGSPSINGTVVRITGSLNDIPTINFASNDYHIEADGVLGVATHDIESNTYGFITTIGEVHGLNTALCPEGAIIYLGVDGAYTHIRPLAPNFVIEIGTCLFSDAVDGTILVNIKGSPYDIVHNSFNDIFIESMKFTVASNGTTITGSLQRAGGGDLTMQFSDGFTTLDCTPIKTITLTAGTATVPQTNYVYALKSTKDIAVSTSGWPSEEHIKISQVACRTAALTQSDGILRNQNWNDHIAGSNGSGHVSHINERIRRLNADWYSGVTPSVSIVSASAPDDVYFSVTGGKVYQMHLQDFPAQSLPTDDIHVVNHFTTPFTTITNLNTQLVDAVNGTLSNRSFSFVIWGVQNETGELSHLMLNLPLGSYISGTEAIKDVENYSVYTIPEQFKGVGFLIARITFSHSPASSGIWTLNQVQDLRGYVPNNTAGGGAQGAGGGVTTYLQLTDTPSTYASSANKLQGVNSGETALEHKAMTVTAAGTASIPTGQQYQINGGSIIVDAIGDGVTTTASSQNAVFDALALKEPTLTKGNLTESITGLEFSATRQVIGGAATLTLSTGYVIPTTDNISHAETAYTHSQNDADLSIINEIQAPTRVGDLIGLTQTATTISIADKAPASGSGNYIQNQFIELQNADAWINRLQSSTAKFGDIGGVNIPLTIQSSGGANGLKIIGRSDNLGFIEFYANNGTTFLGDIYGSNAGLNFDGNSFFSNTITSPSVNITPNVASMGQLKISRTSALSNSQYAEIDEFDGALNFRSIVMGDAGYFRWYGSSNGSTYTKYMQLDLGKLTIPDLAGAGTRLTTVLADGTLSTQANAAGYFFNDGSGNFSNSYPEITSLRSTGATIGQIATSNGAGVVDALLTDVVNKGLKFPDENDVTVPLPPLPLGLVK